MLRMRLCEWLIIVVVIFSMTACQWHNYGMLNPKGIIAFEERRLFFDTLALMLIVVLPVIIMSITFVYHYRVSHRIRDYKPNWSHSYLLESLWWGIPCVIIVVLAIITWKKTYELDPYNKISLISSKPPLLVQVIALPWKWLFIYPEEDIATVNYLVIPVQQQVEYWTTTDNVAMSAFFIPQLGSQIYAMAGMRTRLYLIAEQTGEYTGMNTLFNGDGFSDMKFIAKVVSQDEMTAWVKQVKQTAPMLSEAEYTKLLTPSINAKPAFFSGGTNNLFQNVISTYINSSGPIHPRAQQGMFNNLKE